MTTAEQVEVLRKIFPNANFVWEEIQTGEYQYEQTLRIIIFPGVVCKHETIGTEWSDRQCAICGTCVCNSCE